MNPSRKSLGWKLALTSCLTIGEVGAMIALFANCAFAQIIPDATLPNNSRVTKQDNTNLIEGGTQAGSNLFHSFEEFSVPNGEVAYFNNAVDIQNIISRVTGKSVSNIDGLIRASGTANLFLINPNGIIFGRNARLDIGGSFVASTANSLKFVDGTEFSATAPQINSLLTISVPIGLQFGENGGSIRNQSQASNSRGQRVGLQVQPDKTLGLVGGDVVFEGGILTTAGGRIELGSVAGSNLVTLNPTDKGWALGYEGIQNFRDIQLSQQAVVDASGRGGGNIYVQGRHVTITDGSQMLAKTLGSGLGGTLTINASDSVEVSGESADNEEPSRLTTRTQGAGNAGNLTITTSKLIIEAGGQISAGSFRKSTGTGGTLTVNASKEVQVKGESTNGNVLSRLTTRTEGAGNAGNLTITTPKLIVEAGGQISAGSTSDSKGKGSGGSLTVYASDFVKVSGESIKGEDEDLSRLTTRTLGSKDAGVLTIITGKLIVEAGGQISAGTGENSTGNGGTLTVNASKEVQVKGESTNGNFLSRLTTRTEGPGNAGNLTINTSKLSVQDGGQISAGTFFRSQGAGGNLTITASDSVEVIGTLSADRQIPSRITNRTAGAGDAKTLTINTSKLSVRDGGQISTETANEKSTGQGGSLNINADHVEVIGALPANSDFYPSRLTTRTQGAGKAGDLTINTGKLIIKNGAQVSAGTAELSTAEGGNLTVNASDSVEVIGEDLFGGRFSTRLTNLTRGEGNAATLKINTRKLIIQGGGQVSSNTVGDGLAGNLEVTASDFIEVNGKTSYGDPSRLSAISNTASPAGDLAIATGHLIIQNGAEVSVSGQGSGNAGNLVVKAEDIKLNNGVLKATTASGDGGNLKLDVADILLMRRGSEISTSAGTAQQPGNGGNITINAPDGFIIATPNENSDITANAFSGKGGRVTIKATDIFGIIPLSLQDVEKLRSENLDPRQLQTNDITAISRTNPSLSGTVEINTPDTDPNSGLVELPTIPVDTEVAQGCYSPNVAQSRFVIIGRGGLPPNPKDVLTPDAALLNWVSVKPSNNNHSLPPVTIKPTKSTPKRIVEATGAMLNNKGQIVLTANSSTVTPHTFKHNPIQCHGG